MFWVANDLLKSVNYTPKPGLTANLAVIYFLGGLVVVILGTVA